MACTANNLFQTRRTEPNLVVQPILDRIWDEVKEKASRRQEMDSTQRAADGLGPDDEKTTTRRLVARSSSDDLGHEPEPEAERGNSVADKWGWRTKGPLGRMSRKMIAVAMWEDKVSSTKTEAKEENDRQATVQKEKEMLFEDDEHQLNELNGKVLSALGINSQCR